MISCFDSVVKDLYERYFIEPETDARSRTVKESRKANFLTGIKGLHEDERTSVRQLGPQHIGRLILVRAIVVRVSEVYP